MIAVNNILLNLENPQTWAEKYAKSGIKTLIDSNKSEIYVKEPNPYRVDDKGRIPSPSLGFPLTASVVNKETQASDKWIYVGGEDVLSNGQSIYKAERCNVSKGKMRVIVKDNPELAWFITNLLNLKHYGLIVEDIEAKDRALNAIESDEAAVRFMILSQLKEEELRILAYSWNVNTPEKLVLDSLKRRLIDQVVASQKGIESTKRGYKEFLKECDNINEEVTLRAKINEAIAKNIINIDKYKYTCKYTGTDGVLCAVRPDAVNDPTNTILRHLTMNVSDQETFLNVMDTDGVKLDVLSEADLSRSSGVVIRKYIREKYNIEISKDIKDIQGIRDEAYKIIKSNP
jgi:hypothetical protein